MEISNIKFGKTPLEGKNADKPGSYKQVFRVYTPIIDPGDVLKLELFISGYGITESPKLVSYPSNDIFESSSSKVSHRRVIRSKALSNITEVNPFDSGGIATDLTKGQMAKFWDKESFFFDVIEDNNPVPRISTEMKINDDAPFKYELTTKKSIKPGDYSLQFILTYYNGETWKSDSQSVEFKVRNFLERNDVLIGVFALVASIIAIFTVGIIPLINWIFEII